MIGVTVPEGWGQFWLPKLAAAQAGTGLAKIAAVGDSITQQFWASSRATSWLGLVASALQGTANSSSDGGSGWIGVANTAAFLQSTSMTSGQTASIAADLITLGGTWNIQPNTGTSANQGNIDGPGATVGFTTSNAATATYTGRGRFLKVYYFQFGTTAPAFSANVDSGGTGTGSYTGTTTQQIGVTTIDMGTVGSHSVTITTTNAATIAFWYNGFEFYNSTGVLVNNYGVSSGKGYLYSNITGNQSTAGGIATNANSGTWGPSGLWSGGANNPCDLAIWSFLVNDHQVPINLDVYAHTLNGYLRGVKNGYPSTGGSGTTPTYSTTGANGQTDLLVVMPHTGKTGQSNTLGFSAEYRARAASIARRFGAAFVDFNEIYGDSWERANSASFWGNTASPGTTGTDVVHPGDTGHALMKSVLLPVIQGKVPAYPTGQVIR
jgi:lysophospholipase L1-like esterase